MHLHNTLPVLEHVGRLTAMLHLSHIASCVCSPKDYTMKDIMTYIGDTTRKPVWTVPVPDLATAPFLTAMSIPGMARIAMLPNEEEFYRVCALAMLPCLYFCARRWPSCMCVGGGGGQRRSHCCIPMLPARGRTVLSPLTCQLCGCFVAFVVC